MPSSFVLIAYSFFCLSSAATGVFCWRCLIDEFIVVLVLMVHSLCAGDIRACAYLEGRGREPGVVDCWSGSRVGSFVGKIVSFLALGPACARARIGTQKGMQIPYRLKFA